MYEISQSRQNDRTDGACSLLKATRCLSLPPYPTTRSASARLAIDGTTGTILLPASSGWAIVGLAMMQVPDKDHQRRCRARNGVVPCMYKLY